MRRPIQVTVAMQPPWQTNPKRKPKTVSEGLSLYLRFFIKDKVAFAGLVLIAVFLIWGTIEGIMQELQVIYPYGRLFGQPYGWALIPSNPFALNFSPSYVLQPPSFAHFPSFLFGTNIDGQSILARIMYAAPHDVEAPIIVVGSALVIGMFLGTASGYFGGWVDEAIMRLTDAFLILPTLVLAIYIGVLLGPDNFSSVLIALMIDWWPVYARFFRAQALTVRDRGYIESSKLSGIGSFRVLIKHVIPNSIDPIIAYAALDFGTVILSLALLAFVGIGISLYPEWGQESTFGLDYFPAFWWWAVIPGAVIGAITAAFSLVGDRLQDMIGGRMTY